MKQHYAKIILFCLCCLVGAKASAYDFVVDGIYYNRNEDGISVSVTYKGNYSYSYKNEYTGEVTIPESVTYNSKTYIVTSIDSEAFRGCSGLTSVTIPNSVTSIGSNAFNGCSGLTSVTIPNSVTSIGFNAFAGTAWFNNQEDGLVYIGKFAYAYKGKMPDGTSVTIKNGTQIICGYAFEGCSGLTSVTIPNSVTSIDYGAFYGCSGLTSVTIPNSVTSIGKQAFSGCSGLTSVTIGNSVTNIGLSAFANCSSIASINIPSSLTSIGADAFSGCEKLQKVIVSDLAAWCNIKYGTGASRPLFYAHHLYREDGTEITDLVIPEGVESISEFAFDGGSGFTSVTVPASLKKIGNYAFYGCKGLSVNISDLAAWCSINFGDNPLSYAGRLYDADGTEIQDLTIPAGVESVSSGAFRGCESLKSLVLSNGVKSVGEYAFSNCTNLAKVVIPNSVESIGYGAFQNCLSLYSVTSLINMPINLPNSAFQCTTGKYDQNIIYMAATLYVPRGRVDIYSNVEGWKKFTKIVETDTKFTLTYVLDGKTYKTYEIQATEVVTPEPDPYKEGYKFSGWSAIPSVMPAENVTVYGSFAVDPNYAGIDGMSNDEATPKAYYSVDGKRHETQQKGLNILRLSDGSVRKVMVK